MKVCFLQAEKAGERSIGEQLYARATNSSEKSEGKDAGCSWQD